MKNIKNIFLNYKKYKERHKEKVKENKRKWREKNKKYYLKKNREYQKGFYQKNKDKIKLEIREDYKINKDKFDKRNRKWREKNKDKINNRLTKRRKENKNYNLLIRLRVRVRRALKDYTKTGKIASSKKYGIDYQAIIEFLKPLPKSLKDYNLHHIKPLFAFNFVNENGSTNLEEIKKAFAPKNHKLLTINKHRKINHKRYNKDN